jgi:hypothetical protein
MKAGDGNAPPGNGWDETVLVWNATVARIPRRAASDPARRGAAAGETAAVAAYGAAGVVPPGSRAERPGSVPPWSSRNGG